MPGAVVLATLAATKVARSRSERKPFQESTPCVGDGIAPLAAERAGRDARTRRGLPALEFGGVHHLHHALHGVGIETGGDDFLARLRAFDAALENGVEHVVGRQRILVGLVGAQFRRRRPSHDRARDDLANAFPESRGPGNSPLQRLALRAIGYADIRSGILPPQSESRLIAPP